MASYDLVCEKCDHEFEVFHQGFLKDEDRVCPECGCEDVRQKFSSFLRSAVTWTSMVRLERTTFRPWTAAMIWSRVRTKNTSSPDESGSQTRAGRSG